MYVIALAPTLFDKTWFDGLGGVPGGGGAEVGGWRWPLLGLGTAREPCPYEVHSMTSSSGTGCQPSCLAWLVVLAGSRTAGKARSASREGTWRERELLYDRSRAVLPLEGAFVDLCGRKSCIAKEKVRGARG